MVVLTPFVEGVSSKPGMAKALAGFLSNFSR